MAHRGSVTLQFRDVAGVADVEHVDLVLPPLRGGLILARSLFASIVGGVSEIVDRLPARHVVVPWQISAGGLQVPAG